jgi:hypothetical protein
MADFLAVQMPQNPGLGYVLLFVLYGSLFLLSIAALLRVREPSRASEIAQID